MKKYLHILPACFLFYAAAHAQQKDTVYVTDFGALPYSYENCVTQIQAAIDECKRTGAKVLSLPEGRYDIWPEGATRKEYYISNTSTEQECPSKVKTVGLMLHEIDDLTIEGNGATLMYHGKMTTIALEHCDGVRINNLHIDFERPAGSEIQYRKVTGGETEVTLHRDTRYEDPAVWRGMAFQQESLHRVRPGYGIFHLQPGVEYTVGIRCQRDCSGHRPLQYPGGIYAQSRKHTDCPRYYPRPGGAFHS